MTTGYFTQNHTLGIFIYKSHDLVFEVPETGVWDGVPGGLRSVERCLPGCRILSSQHCSHRGTGSLNKSNISIHEALSSWSDSHPEASLGLRTSVWTLGPHSPIQSTVRSSLKNKIWKKKGKRRETSLWDAKGKWADSPQKGPNMSGQILHLPRRGLLLPQLCPLTSQCPAGTDRELGWLLKQIFVQSLRTYFWFIAP